MYVFLKLVIRFLITSLKQIHQIIKILARMIYCPLPNLRVFEEVLKKHIGMYSRIQNIGTSKKLYGADRDVPYKEDSVQTNTEERGDHATSDRL